MLKLGTVAAPAARTPKPTNTNLQRPGKPSQSAKPRRRPDSQRSSASEVPLRAR
ncbi:hypothetical protein E4U14_004484 [Claviceps sp. LM454 group G7]|nr:hypothetical protein E4U14_004484 [Claviceps sp. LM454 group G7]